MEIEFATGCRQQQDEEEMSPNHHHQSSVHVTRGDLIASLQIKFVCRKIVFYPPSQQAESGDEIVGPAQVLHWVDYATRPINNHLIGVDSQREMD